jgi:hypothetical protein
VDGDVPVARGDDDLAMKGDDHAGSDRSSGWARGVLSASRHTRTVPSSSSPPLAITGLPSLSTLTAIALAVRAGVFQRKHRGRWRWV